MDSFKLRTYAQFNSNYTLLETYVNNNLDSILSSDASFLVLQKTRDLCLDFTCG